MEKLVKSIEAMIEEVKANGSEKDMRLIYCMINSFVIEARKEWK